MKQLLAVLRAIGILALIWVVLGIVGIAFGVVPETPWTMAGGGGGADDADGDDRDDDDADAENEDDDGHTAQTDNTAATSADAGAASVRDAGVIDQRVAVEVPPFAACDGAVTLPSITVVDVVGDTRPEIALGCGARTSLVAWVRRDGALGPVRVATFDAGGEGGSSATGLEAAAARAGDVDGDSLPDLVLPFQHIDQNGGTSGGGLWLVRRNVSGAFEPPMSLAPIAAADAALADLDGRPGAEIAAVNRGSVVARRVSSLWVFAGGAAPSRVAQLVTGVGGRAVAVADLDRDGEKDLVAVSDEEADATIFFGDGTGRFPRRARLPVPNAAEVVAGDVSMDGADDVLLRGVGLQLVVAGPAESLEPRPIDAPSALHQIALFDVDKDQKRDVVGLGENRLLVLRQGDDLAFEERTLFEIEGMHVAGYALADLDADSELDVVLLGRTPEPGSAWEIYVVEHVARTSTVSRANGEAASIPDAPLSLSIALR